ncbi:MAG: hypothetical protein ACRC2V_26230, partial [Xenococcaceae cyanobacterium]
YVVMHLLIQVQPLKTNPPYRCDGGGLSFAAFSIWFCQCLRAVFSSLRRLIPPTAFLQLFFQDVPAAIQVDSQVY